MTKATKASIAVLVLWGAFIAAMALSGCGAPKPPPNVPAGEVSCAEACTHIANDLPLCGTGRRICLQNCESAARNSPEYPTCLARSQSCPALKDCDP